MAFTNFGNCFVNVVGFNRIVLLKLISKNFL